jgi:hypothetical protein
MNDKIANIISNIWKYDHVLVDNIEDSVKTGLINLGYTIEHSIGTTMYKVYFKR